MAKSLAYDAPISLQTSFAQMESHPLTPGLLELVGVYERLRLSGKVPEAVRARLRERGKDFCLVVPPGRTGPDVLPEFVEMSAAGDVAGTRDLRAMVGGRGRGSVATVWHYLGREGDLLLDASGVTAATLQGEPLKTQHTEGKIVIPVGKRRTTLWLEGLGPGEVRRLLAGAQFRQRRP
jgi:hypothetical protein